MVRDLAMPGGGAAIKVSRTDQFALEISKGRLSCAAFSYQAKSAMSLLVITLLFKSAFRQPVGRTKRHPIL
jgi:hypothetical protein